MAKKKYYAVAEGRSRGIFTDWPTAEKQVKGFGGAKYKSFPSESEAKAWLANPVYKKKVRQPRAKQLPQESVTDPEAIVIYTDGGAINNPGPGGYGVVIQKNGNFRELTGGYRFTTNNRMEMMAAIVALKEVQDAGRAIYLYSDSSYLVNGINKGWAKKWRTNQWRKGDGQPVLNVDLWKELLEQLDGVEVSFNWVKGHAGNELNERCDRLAVSAARGKELAADEVYENVVNRKE